MKRQQAWRLEDADRIDWWHVAEVVVGGSIIALAAWLFLVWLGTVA